MVYFTCGTETMGGLRHTVEKVQLVKKIGERPDVNPMNSMKRQNDRILKEKLPRSVGAQYATGDQWRNNSRKNEGMEPK